MLTYIVTTALLFSKVGSVPYSMARSVFLLIGRSSGRSSGLSVIISYKLHFHAFIGALVFLYNMCVSVCLTVYLGVCFFRYDATIAPRSNIALLIDLILNGLKESVN